MVAVIKNIRMFVSFYAKGTDIFTLRGFLYPIDCYYLQRYKAVQISCIPLRFKCNGSFGEDERRTAFLISVNSNFVDTMPKENEICSRAKHSTPSATADARQASESTSNKLAIVESCIIDLVRMKSLMYNHDLINPFPDQYPTAIDPFDLLDDVIRFINDLSILHAELGKEVACV